MPDQITRSRLTYYVLALLAIYPLNASAIGSAALHLKDYDDVVVEHAELVASENGVPDLAYLTIYNGSEKDMAITSISVEGYASATLMQKNAGIQEFARTALDETYLIIPSRAELDMGRDTMFVALSRSGRLARALDLTIKFADGTMHTVPLSVLSPGVAETSHHHAAAELE